MPRLRARASDPSPCLRPGARRNKRWARHTRRGLRLRDNGKASKWRAHKRQTQKLMNWVRARVISCSPLRDVLCCEPAASVFISALTRARVFCVPGRRAR